MILEIEIKELLKTNRKNHIKKKELLILIKKKTFDPLDYYSTVPLDTVVHLHQGRIFRVCAAHPQPEREMHDSYK